MVPILEGFSTLDSVQLSRQTNQRCLIHEDVGILATRWPSASVSPSPAEGSCGRFILQLIEMLPLDQEREIREERKTWRERRLSELFLSSFRVDVIDFMRNPRLVRGSLPSGEGGLGQKCLFQTS